MTEQEKINENVQRQIDAQNARIDNVLTKVDMLVAEMRDRDNQRVEDIREIRASIQNMQNSLQDLQSSSRTLNIATIIGIAAIVVAVLLK